MYLTLFIDRTINNCAWYQAQHQQVQIRVSHVFILALVPTSAIPTCLAMFLSAVPDDANCMTLYAYFENQWTVTMPPDMWNSYSDSQDRTTNRVEGFHSKLNKMLNKAHPNIHVLINVFKKLEAKYEISNYSLRNREQIHKRTVYTC